MDPLFDPRWYEDSQEEGEVQDEDYLLSRAHGVVSVIGEKEKLCRPICLEHVTTAISTCRSSFSKMSQPTY
jgi:hypothetical protein